MSRFPIRVRLTLAFVIAMAVLLAGTGAFVYFRVDSSLNEAVIESLDARLTDAKTLATRGQSGLDEEEAFTVIVDRNQVPFLSPEQLRDAKTDPIDIDGARSLKGRVRVLAADVDTRNGPKTVVVGTSLGDRDDAVNQLLAQLVIVGPIALLLSAALGYWLAGAALRPVEEMRVEAAAISGADPGRRLPVGKARDEITRLAETLNAMLYRLERAIERERGFVADASHELRTPLALMKAELDLALRKPRSHAELNEALRSAAAETDRLVRLAEDLLVLAQADDGRLPLRRDDLHAADLISTVQEAFQARAEQSGRRIEAEPANGVALSGDRLRLEQALGNLVDNAIRYGAGEIRLEARRNDGSVELLVSDNGGGFPAEFLPRAFERFSRADESRARGAAGLGLALVEAIVRAHGGTASAANRPGGGAAITLSLAA
jgi:two-component system, OmpR family, sensor kinase